MVSNIAAYSFVENICLHVKYVLKKIVYLVHSEVQESDFLIGFQKQNDGFLLVKRDLSGLKHYQVHPSKTEQMVCKEAFG